MTGALIAMFVAAFAVAPLLFLSQTRSALTRRRVVTLVIVGIFCALMAQSLPPVHKGLHGVGQLVLLWLAWICAVSLAAMASGHRMTHHRRWVALIGTYATTLPWFGLATAQMMAP